MFSYGHSFGTKHHGLKPDADSLYIKVERDSGSTQKLQLCISDIPTSKNCTSTPSAAQQKGAIGTNDMHLPALLVVSWTNKSQSGHYP